MNASRVRRVLIVLLLLGLLALLASACGTETAQNTFAPKGEVARDQRNLFYYAMWPAIGVMIFVELGLVVMLLRFRRRRPDEVPKQLHGNTRLEVAWTIAPALLLLVLAVPMMSILFKLGREPHADDFVINVTGRQWVWQFEYPDIKDAKGNPISVFSEFHFPAGREIRFNIRSEDVIHSFAIPRLAGTLDAIPVRPGQDFTNRLWIKADEPATLAGQCREFCGLGHAGMKIMAHADSEADFAAWVKEKQQGPKPAGGSASPSPTPTAPAAQGGAQGSISPGQSQTMALALPSWPITS